MWSGSILQAFCQPGSGGGRFMPRVLGVHGIAQQFKGGYQLVTVWFDALRDGLVVAGHRPVADSLAPTDLRVAFFGDLFRPEGALAGGGPPYTVADVEPGLERDLLAKFYQAAVEQDPSLGPPPGALGASRAVQAMLERLLRSRTFARVAQRGFIGNLKQVTAFPALPDVKEKVLQRVHGELTPDTQIIIGHSLGSVVVYEYIARYRPPRVKLLVTLGSPLGIPNLVFDKLTPKPVDGLGVWPGTVARWVNVADPDDIVALRKQLAPLFHGPGGAAGVEDHLVDNGDDPHATSRYLNAEPTGAALGRVL
jgi:pimeloyl-ACP methyl ester carboxylesterase